MAGRVGTRKKGWCRGCGVKIKAHHVECGDCHRQIVPVEIAIEVIMSYKREGETDTDLATRICPYPTYIHNLKKRDREGVRWTSMDSMICKAGDPLRWHQPPLKEFYWANVPPDYSTPVKCENPRCDKWFSLEIKDLHKSHCSDHCRNIAGQIRRGERRLLPKEPRLVECVWCGTGFLRYPTATGGTNTKYCSGECKKQAKRERDRVNYEKAA